MLRMSSAGLMLWLLAFPAMANTNNDASVKEALELIFESSRSVNTIESDFTQIQELSMLTDPIVSTGRFYFQKNDALRWEVTKPEPMGFWVKGSEGKRWKGNENHTQTFTVSSVPFIDLFARQVFAWTNGNMELLTAHYQMEVVEKCPLVFKLVPIKADEEQHLAHVQLTFSEALDHIQEVLIRLKDGDQTKIVFSNTVLNMPFPNALFK